MAQGVGQRFSRRQRRIERFVYPLEAVLLESTGDGQGVAQETLRVREQCEGVAVELAVVQEPHLVDTSETSDAKQALRHIEFEAIRVAEQHRRRPK